MEEKLLNENKIAIVIPYYNASKQIISVISKIPSYITCVIIVDDKSKEALPKEELQKKINPKTKLVFLENERNLGVGGATKKGFQYAISQDLDILVKIDADDQMDLSFLPEMVVPISQNKTMVSKGNRFRNTKALQKMPVPRKLGNLILSFLVKIATGYWHNFDPTNGFIAIKSDVIRKIDFTKLSNRYYFETSLLSQLYFQKTSILDIAMPAIYGDEKSNMNLSRMVFVFLGNLSKTFFKRILKSYFLYDFNIGSVYIFFGIPLFIFGIIYGISTWIYSAIEETYAPTGTIMIITLSIILGFQLVLQAIQFDIFNAPRNISE